MVAGLREPKLQVSFQRARELTPRSCQEKNWNVSKRNPFYPRLISPPRQIYLFIAFPVFISDVLATVKRSNFPQQRSFNLDLPSAKNYPAAQKKARQLRLEQLIHHQNLKVSLRSRPRYRSQGIREIIEGQDEWLPKLSIILQAKGWFPSKIEAETAWF